MPLDFLSHELISVIERGSKNRPASAERFVVIRGMTVLSDQFN